MSQLVIPDWLFDARQWLKAHPYLTTAPTNLAGRVFFDVPDKPSAYPLLRVYASVGPTSAPAQDAPLFDARLSIEVIGDVARSSYQSVRQAAQAVQSAIFDLAPGPLNPPNGTTYCSGGYTTGAPDVPYPDSGQPRIVVDAVLSIRAVGPADP